MQNAGYDNATKPRKSLILLIPLTMELGFNWPVRKSPYSNEKGETEVNTGSDGHNLPKHPSEEGTGRFDLLVGFGHQLHGLLLFA